MEPLLIAHRGNLSGRMPEIENSPGYIDIALEEGFDVEVDIWSVNDDLFLGHDLPQYGTTLEWLAERSGRLWIHCKNAAAVRRMSETHLNWFFHESDPYTLTSHGFIWGYPGVEPVGEKFISLWFEAEKPSTTEPDYQYAFCGDFIANWSFR